MKKVFSIIFSFLLISFSYSLKITEVYFDGSDEFIGIYNNGNKQFSGNIQISGVKSSKLNIDIQIKPKQEVLVGDAGTMLSGLKLAYSGEKLSISDTKAINIKIFSGEDVLDSFYVNSGEVNKLNNKKTSFEKIYSGGVRLVQAVQQPVNVKNGYIANPGFVNIFSGTNTNLNTGSSNTKSNNIVQTKVLNCKLNLQNISGGIYNFSYTGNLDLSGISWYKNNVFISSGQILSIGLIGENNLVQGVGIDTSGNVCTGSFFLKKENKELNIFTGSLKINEIHPNKDNNFDEYVELKAFGNISGDYLFSGFSSSNHIFSVNLKLYSGNTIVFAKSYSGFKYTGNVILEKLSLKDNGEILQIINPGEVIDNVEYTKGNYLYFTKFDGGIRLFDTEGLQTPGYENYVKNYFSTKENVNCNIIKQSEEQIGNQLKINLDSEVSDNKYCGDSYRQIWTYSGGVITGTCNPGFMYLNTGDSTINFKIQNLSGDDLCEDNYHISYLQKQDNIENKQLNCYIKIQSKADYFLSNSSINFITVINNQEIQNSNTHYSCKYILSGQVLSNKCNPGPLNLSGGLHKINLSITGDDDKTCQTVYYLNLPSENIKIERDTYKEAVNPTNCVTMNSNDLQILVNNISTKYKSDTTLKKVFNSVKYLFLDKDDNFVKKSNSDKLRQFVQQIDSKYKSDITLKKIFQPISYLYEKDNLLTGINIETGNYLNTGFLLQTGEKLQTSGSVQIVGILPNPVGADKGKEAILLSGEINTGLYLQVRQRKYNLSKYVLTGNNYLFTGTFNFGNTSSCVSLFSSGDILQDRKCYLNPSVGKYVYNFITGIILEKNTSNNLRWLKLTFSGDKIIVKFGNQKKIFVNQAYKLLLKKTKKIIKITVKYFTKLLKQNKKLEKQKDKVYYIYLKYYAKYLILKTRFNNLKEEFLQYKKNNRKKYKNKNLMINTYKKQISFLKKFLSSVKKNIDYKKYQKYLKNYKELKIKSRFGDFRR